jgi:dimethylargininase
VLTKAIVRPPSANFAEGLSGVDLGKPDYELALKQHEAYCRVLEACGLSLIRLPPDERYPDSTFVEDTAVLTARGAVIAQPGAPSRLGEIDDIELVLHDFFNSFYAIHEDGRLDGGDVCEAGDHFFIGVSRRTNEAGAAQLTEFLDAMGYGATLIDIRSLGNILHLKSGLAYLGSGNRLAVIDELKDLKQFSGYDLVEVEPAEAYAANCLVVNDRVLLASGFQHLQDRLQKLGHETIALDMSEFQKMDGGLSCLSLRF